LNGKTDDNQEDLMGWMDVLIGVICIVSCIKGWQKGWFVSAFHIGEFLVAGMAAKKYYLEVSAFLFDQPIFSGILQERIFNRMQSVSYPQAVPGSILAQRSIFQRLNLPLWLEESLMESETVQVYNTGAMEGKLSFFSGLLTEVAIDFISLFLVFIGAKVVLSIVGHLLKPIGKPFGRNPWAGLFFGLARGLLTVFVLFGLLVPIFIVAGSPVLTEGLEQSVLARMLYDYNPIAWLIQSEM